MKTNGKLKNNFLLKAHTEPGKQDIFRNSQGQPGIFLYQLFKSRKNQGKNFLAHISLSLTLACLFPKWLSNFFSVIVQFIILQGAVASICL